jgi:hypothetical protein
MAYTIQAIITKETVSSLYSGPGLSWTTLSQAMTLAPLGTSFCEQNSIPFLPFTDEGLKSVPAQIAEICEAISLNGKVAYIEAEFHGGDGGQAAILWNKGKIISEIIVAEDAINQALKYLDVKNIECRDEFEALGLGRYRKTDDWNKPQKN